ncbi:MAG: hypothetical protein U1E73_08080 [Planctomycetota bacterium]
MRIHTWSRIERAIGLVLLLAGATTWFSLRCAAIAKAAELGRREAQLEHLETMLTAGPGRAFDARALRSIDGLFDAGAVAMVGTAGGAVLGLRQCQGGGRP